MKFRITSAIAIILISFALGVGVLRNRSKPERQDRSPASITLADRQRARAEALIELNPSGLEGYNLLAAAFLQKSREIGDESFLDQAESAIGKSLEIDRDNLDVVMLHAKVLMSHHEFKEALEEARRAQSIRQDSPDVHGVEADALIELGDYRAAVDAAQRMMDLRPDLASYSRTSYLRALHGDIDGAIQAMEVALKAANPADREGVAWCHVQLANLRLSAGEPIEAERQADTALEVFPEYHEALAIKGRILAASNKLSEAAELYRQALDRVRLPDVAAALGDVYTRIGEHGEAKRAYETAQTIDPDHGPSRELAVFLADHNQQLDEALEIARQERARRSDIYTCDALAWCLFKKGRAAEAKSSIDEALRLGTRDAGILYHAGMIYDALGDRTRAARYLKDALRFKTSFDNSVASFSALQENVARVTLESLK